MNVTYLNVTNQNVTYMLQSECYISEYHICKCHLYESDPHVKIGRTDEDCLQMSIFLPKSNYQRAVIYFVTTNQIEPSDAMSLAYDTDTAIFVINLRNGIFGYFHEGIGNKHYFYYQHDCNIRMTVYSI